MSSSGTNAFFDLKDSSLSITLKSSSSIALSLFCSFRPSSTAYSLQ